MMAPAAALPVPTPPPRPPAARGLVRVQAGPAAGPSAEDWLAFKRRYLAPDGRVVDTGNAGISHSEGQSYGMLFAEHFNERDVFDQVWGWTLRTLRRPSDALLAWKYVPRAAVPVPDANNASDGDLIAAWALLRAAQRWGEPRYAESAGRAARAVLAACTTEFVGRRILLPGAQGFLRQGRIVVNPSYFAFNAMRALSRLVPDAAWAALEASSLDILRASGLGRWRLPPDWCEISGDAVLRPAADWPPRFSWDAIRVPVHLAWAGLQEPALRAAAEFFTDPAHAFHPPAWADLYTNAIAPYAGHAGVLAVARLAAQRSGLAVPQRHVAVAEAPDYYGASLVLLSGLAATEAPEPPAMIPPLPPRPPGWTERVATAMRSLVPHGDRPATGPGQPEQNPLARLGGRAGERP